MKYCILISFLFTGSFAQAWTHKNIIQKVSGFYHATQSEDQFVIRQRAGNQLELSFKLGTYGNVMLMECQKSSEELFTCVARDRVRYFQITVGKTTDFTFATLNVDGQEMTDYFVKIQAYKIKF